MDGNPDFNGAGRRTPVTALDMARWRHPKGLPWQFVFRFGSRFAPGGVLTNVAAGDVRDVLDHFCERTVTAIWWPETPGHESLPPA